MGHKSIVEFTDDLTGLALTEHVTVQWSVNGEYLEFDTTAESAKQFVELLSKYHAASRPSTTQGESTPVDAPSPTLTTDQSKAVRRWAQQNGHAVGSRGRISFDLIKMYGKIA